MRVVITHKDADHPNAGPFAFRLGRIQGGTDIISGIERTAHEVVELLVEQAKKEYTEAEGYVVRVEKLLADETDADGNVITHKWVGAEKNEDGEWAPAQAPGSIKNVTASSTASTIGGQQ